MDRVRLRNEINIAKLALGIGTFLVAVLWLAGGAILDERYYTRPALDQKLEHVQEIEDIKFRHIDQQLEEIKNLIQDL